MLCVGWINRQSVRNGDQAIVTWAISGKPVPEPIGDPFDFDDEDEDLSPVDDPTLQALITVDNTPDLSSDLDAGLLKKSNANSRAIIRTWVDRTAFYHGH